MGIRPKRGRRVRGSASDEREGEDGRRARRKCISASPVGSSPTAYLKEDPFVLGRPDVDQCDRTESNQNVLPTVRNIRRRAPACSVWRSLLSENPPVPIGPMYDASKRFVTL